jgi:hypothetical protein
MQEANDRSFEIEAKFDSIPSGTYASQGLIVEQDADNFLQYYFFSWDDPSRINLYAAKVVGGTVQPELYNEEITSDITGTPMYLRLTRQGDQWTLWYSDNGTIWIQADTFSHSMTVTSVGVFVGNGSTGDPPQDPPGFTAEVDYFYQNMVAP